VLNAAFRGDYHLRLNREKRGGDEKFPLPHGVGGYDENCLICCSCWLSVGQEKRAEHPEEGIPERDQIKCLSPIKRIWIMLHVWVALLSSRGACSSWCMFIEGFLLILLLHRANALQNK